MEARTCEDRIFSTEAAPPFASDDDKGDEEIRKCQEMLDTD